MKKYISILLVFVIVLSLSGCDLYIDTDAIVGRAKDKATEVVEDAVDEAVAQTENKITNARGKLIGCNHEPNKYKKKKNTVLCRCGANKFDDLEYKEFVDCIPRWRLLRFNKEKYCAKLYVQYKGVDPVFIKLASKISVEEKGVKDISAQLEELGGLFDELGSALDVNNFYGEVIGDSEAVELIESASSFTRVLGKATQITGLALNICNMTRNADDPAALCNDFIDAVRKCTDQIPGFSVQMTCLSKTLDLFWGVYKDYDFQLTATGAILSENNSIFTTEKWSWFCQKAQWEKGLSGVKGLEGTDFLPSVKDVLTVYDELDETGKALADHYLMFRMDIYFNDIMGITFQEYVESLSE